MLLVFILWACNSDFYSLPAQVQPGIVNMVIEIPAGTTLKTEYNETTRKFEAPRVNGVPRRVQYLPYPGNYGFIPSTRQPKEKGGDGDALDIVLLADAIPKERVIQAIPIAVLHLTDGGENDSKIIAVPVNGDLRTINCTQFTCLKENYPSVLTILETWFANYKGRPAVNVMRWGNEEEAKQEINLSVKNK
jgi:inorganic pyrophosphatase